MDFAILAAELTDDPLSRGYASMTAQQAADSLNTANIVVPYTRFLSLRALAAVLTDAEYAAFKSFLPTVAAGGPRYADMVAMLEKPCSDSGDTGGLDFGCADVRTLVDTFGAIEGMSTAAANVKALAERTISRATQLTLPSVTFDAVEVARGERPLTQYEVA